MSFSSRAHKNRQIIAQLDEEYKQASFWLPFEALRIKEVFSADELSTVADLIEEMEVATNDHERVSTLVEKADTYAGSILKLLRIARVIP